MDSLKRATEEEIHHNETAGADSRGESLLWSKFTDITSPSSWDAVSFFRNVGKSWAQQKLNVVLSFPSRLAAPVEWNWNSECLLWWFEICIEIVPGGTFPVCRTKKLNNHLECSFWFTADVQLISVSVFSPCFFGFEFMGTFLTGGCWEGIVTLWCRFRPHHALLWNVRWPWLGLGPPWDCLCGLPQWEWQGIIGKHEPAGSTHLLGWLLCLQLLIQADKQHFDRT